MSRTLTVAGLSLYIAASCALAYFFPQSVLAFLLVEGSLLLLYYVPVSGRVKSFRRAGPVGAATGLGVLDAYYFEIAIDQHLRRTRPRTEYRCRLRRLLNRFVAFYTIAPTYGRFSARRRQSFHRRLVSVVAQLVLSF
jgi:hypothetical protein